MHYRHRLWTPMLFATSSRSPTGRRSPRSPSCTRSASPACHAVCNDSRGRSAPRCCCARAGSCGPRYAGSVFKRHVDAVLHALDDGLAATEELIDPETGTVRVAFQLSLGTWFVPDVIAAFREEHPRIRFRFEHSHDALGSSLVAGGRTDLEFTARRPRNPDVVWEWLFQQPLHLAVPPGHRLADRDEVVPRRSRGRRTS